VGRGAESSSSAAVQHRLIAEEEGKKKFQVVVMIYVNVIDRLENVQKKCMYCIRIHKTNKQ